MDNSTLKYKSHFFSKSSIPIAEHRKAEFLEEILGINIHREKILSVVLIIIDIIMLYSDIFSPDSLRVKTHSLNAILYANIAMLVIPSAYLLIFYIIKRFKIKSSYTVRKVLHLSLVSAILLLCSFLSFEALLTQGQLFSFAIAIFCIASMGLFSLYERIIVYISTYVFFITGVFIIRDSVSEFFWVTLFITVLTAVAIIASRMNFSAYVNKFNSNRVILENSIQLGNMYKNLDSMYKNTEEALKNRTRELTEANVQLINEMIAKHEMEIEYMRTRLLCEEKERSLNEAAEYEKLRTAFFANISHELRTPLNVIFSAEQMVVLLLKGVKLEEPQKEINRYMHIIKQNCYRLIRLIANLIDITKIDAGYFQVNFKNCDIVGIVEDITLSVAKYVESGNLSLVFDTEIEEKVISCDPDKIERTILNLLSNAVKFTPKGGEIYVTMYEKEGRVVISIRDTGIGIPPEMRSTVFERFVQVDKTTSRNSEGSGIGLSLVKSLVEMHGGNISLVSECGKGSEFIIELPDRTEAESEAAADINTEMPGSDNVERINIEFSDIYFN